MACGGFCDGHDHVTPSRRNLRLTSEACYTCIVAVEGIAKPLFLYAPMVAVLRRASTDPEGRRAKDSALTVSKVQ